MISGAVFLLLTLAMHHWRCSGVKTSTTSGLRERYLNTSRVHVVVTATAQYDQVVRFVGAAVAMMLEVMKL